jgi:hypothetical protein
MKTANVDTSRLKFPLAAFHSSLTKQNLFHILTFGIPCFLLIECVPLSGLLKWRA